MSTSRNEEVEVKVEFTEEERAFINSWDKNRMRQPTIKVVSVNFSVGSSGPQLEKARMLCEKLTNQKPAEGKAKESVRGFAIRKHEPIAVFTTLRDEKAHIFLEKCIWAKENVLLKKNFDEFGNLAFGIKEHLDLPNMKYDPQIGVLGFDITIVLNRAGFRIKNRRKRPKKVPKNHKITKDEGIAFFKKYYKINVLEKEPERW